MDPGLPLVSYVLVNWRTEEWLARALRSVMEQDGALREVWLVNNASPGWNPELLAEFPDVQLIDLDRNRGFAGGNNLALRRCNGDYVVLLNCDAFLAPGFTRTAVKLLTKHQQVGTVAAKVLRDQPELDGLWRIDSCGHLMRQDRTAFGRGAGELDQGQYEYRCRVFGASAAATVYRRSMLEELETNGEYFDETFFAYYEDVDLDWRAQLAGWEAWYEPTCVAYHRGHASGGRSDWRLRLRAEKNRYLMCLKNDSLTAQWRAAAPLLQYELWHFLQVLLRPTGILGLLLLLFYLPSAVQRRVQAMHSRRRTSEDVAESFVQRGPPAPLPRLTEQHDTDSPSSGSEQFPLASVVLVNFNGLPLTSACLLGLARQSYPRLEVVVVDNGSRKNEARELAREFPWIRTLRLESNQGFTGGCNWGISLARGEWVILLNNDAIPDPDCVRRLVYAQRTSGAAAVSGRLVDIAEPELAGLTLRALELETAERDGEPIVWDLPDELSIALGRSHENSGLSWFGYIVDDAFGERPECFYPSGGLCCLPRATLDRLGPEVFPQHWFAYYEDVALGFRIRSMGGQVQKEIRAAAVHLASSTARSLGSARLAFLRERNRIQLLRTWLPRRAIWALLPVWLLQPLCATAVLLCTRPGAALGFVAAHLWAIASHSFLSRQRRQADSLRRQGADWGGLLCGKMRGRDGIINELTLALVRLARLPCLEDATQSAADD